MSFLISFAKLIVVLTFNIILIPFTSTVIFGLNLPRDELAIALFVITHIILGVMFFRPFRVTALLILLLALLVGLSTPLANVHLDPEMDAQSFKAFKGKTVLLTGPSDLGSAVARQFLERGANVIVLGRSMFSKMKITRNIEEQTRLDGFKLDLADLLEIPPTVKIILEKYPRIDVVIANAGSGGPATDDDKDQRSPLGYESTANSNHLGHALLIHELTPALQRSPNPRVIIVSSRMHEVGTQDMKIEDLTNWTLTYPSDSLSLPAYSRSKLLNLLYARGLAKHLDYLTAVSLTPGTVATSGMPSAHLTMFMKALKLPTRVTELLTSFLIMLQRASWRSPNVAAQIYLYAALVPRELVNGQYIDADMSIRDPATLIQPQTSDAWAESVWSETLRMLKMWGTLEYLS